VRDRHSHYRKPDRVPAPTGHYEELWVEMLRARQPSISEEGLVLGLVLFRYALVNDDASAAADVVVRLEAPLRSRPAALQHLFDLAPGWPGSPTGLVDAAVRASF
jgi:hypothetical protein